MAKDLGFEGLVLWVAKQLFMLILEALEVSFDIINVDLALVVWSVGPFEARKLFPVGSLLHECWSAGLGEGLGIDLDGANGSDQEGGDE